MVRWRRAPAPDDLALDSVLLAGGLAALLLQVGHPAVGAAVHRHSGFAEDPLGRLVRTVQYLYVVAAGAPEERARIGREVGVEHRPVRSVPGTAPAFDARDPELQRFVAATITWTALRIRALVWSPPAPAERDALVRTGASVGTSLGMPAALWPASAAEFDAYWTATEPAVRFEGEAGAIARQLLTLGGAPRAARAALPALRFITAGLLPAGVRERAGFRWTPRRARRFDRLVAVVRTVHPLLPTAVRTLPARLALRAVRRRWSARPRSAPPSLD